MRLSTKVISITLHDFQTNDITVILFNIVESASGSDSDQSDSDSSSETSHVRQKPTKQRKKPMKLELSANEIGRLLVKAVDNGKRFDLKLFFHPIRIKFKESI